MAQRVLVTAGAAGIGKEIARAFAMDGATVCVCDINAQTLDENSQGRLGVAVTRRMFKPPGAS